MENAGDSVKNGLGGIVEELRGYTSIDDWAISAIKPVIGLAFDSVKLTYGQIKAIFHSIPVYRKFAAAIKELVDGFKNE